MRLKIDNLYKSHGSTPLFERVSIDSKARVLGLIGASGSGKSSLIRLIAGLDMPKSGTITVDEVEVPCQEGEQLELYRKSLGVVFQSWNLFPHLSAIENICLPLIVSHHMTKELARARSEELLERFDLLKHKNKNPSELSGGQNQRVAILRAIAHRPKILLLDEPTSALDPVMTSEVLDLLFELTQQGSAFILASHHIPFLRQITDEVVFMHEGKVIEHAKSSKFFNNPTSTLAKEYIDRVLKYTL